MDDVLKIVSRLVAQRPFRLVDRIIQILIQMVTELQISLKPEEMEFIIPELIRTRWMMILIMILYRMMATAV